ncbi:zinc finger, CCHC-type containing protein [Tanacetum coccineum]
MRIEESLRAQDSDKGKGKEVDGPFVNMTEDGKNKNNKQNKGKKRGFKKNNNGSSSNKCGKTGHFKRDCRSGKKNNANAGGSGKGSKDQSQEQGQNLVHVWNRFVKYYVLLISKAFYVQVDAIAWWIDSGDTTHVCKDRCWFKTYEPVEDGFVLYMGDDHFTPVHGKGSVVLKFSLGKSITLFNVLHVLKLCKNSISGPVLNKCGYKQVYESDKYILAKSGVFVGFGYYNNGMFMLNLNKVPDDSGSVYISSSTGFNSSLWHARLGHVNYKRMLEMFKDDLIPDIDENLEKYTTFSELAACLENASYSCTSGHVEVYQNLHLIIIHETTAPYTPQQNGVAKRKNRALKEMASGPKKENFGEKGIDCIFVGYAKHSKAYRFYVIEPNDSVSINSIIESRDVIFDENRFSSIPRPKDIIPNSDKSQRGDHSNDVPTETPEPRSCKWIFKRKMKVNGTIDKFKARLVIQGFRQKEVIDYFDTYAPVAHITTIRLLLALAAIHNLVIHKMDVKTIFFNGDLEEEVYMKQPTRFVMPCNEHKLIDDSDLTKEEVVTRWVKVMPIKINVFAWRVHLDKLPTRLNLTFKCIDI